MRELTQSLNLGIWYERIARQGALTLTVLTMCLMILIG